MRLMLSLTETDGVKRDMEIHEGVSFSVDQPELDQYTNWSELSDTDKRELSQTLRGLRALLIDGMKLAFNSISLPAIAAEVDHPLTPSHQPI